MTLAERDAQVIWHPYTQMKTAKSPIAIVKGEGAYLFDEQGKKYIDAVASWWVNIHGHAHPYIAQKLSEQVTVLEHVIFAGFTHEPAVCLAERLLELLPGNQSKMFYTDNGSTAVEVALKMAIQYWTNQGRQKNKIIAFENAYHGDTFGSMSVSARSAFTDAFSPFLFDVITIPLPVDGNSAASVAAMKREIQKSNGTIAAFIFEPLILGAGGMLMYEPEALDELLQVCKEQEIICIADEVMTGFGRTGKLFASAYLNHKPDIMCLSKGITGGTMALGATSCNDKIYQAFLSDDSSKTLFHGHSYTANPLACTAGVASLDLLLAGETQTAITYIGEQHKRFAERLEQFACVQNIRYRGTIIAFDIKTKEGVSYFSHIRDELYEFFLEKGIVLRPLGNTLYMMPPYCIRPDDLEFVYQMIELRLSRA